ncbi:MAG: isovaleryl-CoA dehydrogenase, partial [Actinomycetota bacterium]|nr:isovaleryl-CoA dehydrogenase [Actinomycetota bacterium]
APAADEVDRDGVFPRAAVTALGEAGLLGLASSPDVGGGGLAFPAVAPVIERLAGACGSTAMVVLMHYAATATIEAQGPTAVREAIAAGRCLATLAFSEVGSRSHFWAPLSTATALEDGSVSLDAHKSWVTAAGEADVYVWSSRPLAADGPMTIWLVPSDAPGLRVAGPFDGLGLRGNASRPVDADGVTLAADAMLGDDGAGLDLALATALPWFLVLNAAFSLGLAEAVTTESIAHLTGSLAHLDQSLAQQVVPRLDLARMRIDTDRTRTFLDDTTQALVGGRADAMLRVLEVKAVAAEAAVNVTDLAMKVCGGAAFRKELGIERRFRDARAARVMAPTTDALLDFVGRAICGLPLIDSPAGA